MANWEHGLCGCFDNCFVCIVTYLVPCYTYGKNAEAVGDNCLLCGLVFFVPLVNIFYGGMNRQKIREQKGIEGGIVSDILTFCCCTLCALTQASQEVNSLQSQSIDRE